MQGSNIPLSSRIQTAKSKVFNRNVMTYVIICLLFLTLGLLNFSDPRYITFSIYRLTSVSFWTTFLTRTIGTYILKYIFLDKGKNTKKENTVHIERQREILEFRQKIEADDRIEEFREYVDEEVNLYDLIESYDRLLKNKIQRKTKKVLGFIYTRRRKKLVEDMYRERKYIADLRGALNSKDEERIEEALKYINMEEINVKGRPDISSDTMFDGVKYDEEEVLSPLAFNESKETARKLIGNPLLTFLSFSIVTVMFNDFIFSTDDWLNKVINILITIIIWVFISVFAFDSGVTISDKLLQSKDRRLTVFKTFIARPKKDYAKPIKIQPEVYNDVIEGI